MAPQDGSPRISIFLLESVAAAVLADGKLTAPDFIQPVNAAVASDKFLETLGTPRVLERATARGRSIQPRGVAASL